MAIAARIAMIATTIISSIRVKPLCDFMGSPGVLRWAGCRAANVGGGAGLFRSATSMPSDRCGVRPGQRKRAALAALFPCCQCLLGSAAHARQPLVFDQLGAAAVA